MYQDTFLGGAKVFAADLKRSAVDDFDLARIFDIRHGVSAYPVVWMLVWLLAIGVLTLSILILQQDGLTSTSYNYTIFIATMAAVIVALTTLGAVMRVVYASQWDFSSLLPKDAAAAAAVEPPKIEISAPIGAPHQGFVATEVRPVPAAAPNPLQQGRAAA